MPEKTTDSEKNSLAAKAVVRPALEVLVAACDENVIMLAEHMNLKTEALICNQCHEVSYQEFLRGSRMIRTFAFNERGVGLNRNNALMRARGEIILFADDDIVYDDLYEEKILGAFAENPEADLILFNVQAAETRVTYENTRRKRIRFYNYSRYPTYSIAARLDRIRRANVHFSLLYGGGALYSNGEDSLFLHDCLKKRLKIYAVPVRIGREQSRFDGSSTWFTGYTDKFFFDRGVLYKDLYGIFALPMALRFLVVHRDKFGENFKLGPAFAQMRKGIALR